MNFRPLGIENTGGRILVTFELLRGCGRGVWKSKDLPKLEKRCSAELDIVDDFFLGHNAVIFNGAEFGISILGNNNIIIGRILDQYNNGTSWLQIPGAGTIALDLDEINLKGKMTKLIVPFENLILTPC